jgi:hypothetical protein
VFIPTGADPWIQLPFRMRAPWRAWIVRPAPARRIRRCISLSFKNSDTSRHSEMTTNHLLRLTYNCRQHNSPRPVDCLSYRNAAGARILRASRRMAKNVSPRSHHGSSRARCAPHHEADVNCPRSQWVLTSGQPPLSSGRKASSPGTVASSL